MRRAYSEQQKTTPEGVGEAGVALAYRLRFWRFTAAADRVDSDCEAPCLGRQTRCAVMLAGAYL
jgi:hypothetical protein